MSEHRRHSERFHRGHDLFEDVCRALIAGAALTLLALAQVHVAAAAGLDGDVGLVESALKQGGLFALMVLVMFFYRRDWAKLNNYQQETNKQLIDLIQKNIGVITEMRDELRRKPCLYVDDARRGDRGDR